ncbi:hypothetical protein [Intestinibacter sp.]
MSKRKVKKSAILIMGIICFFIIYFISFRAFSGLGQGKGTKIVSTEEKVDTRSLLSQFKNKNKIYISDGNVSNVRMEQEKVQEFRYSFNEFSKIRTPDSYTPVYEGYTDDDIKFSTDLNVFRVYTVNQEEYYKVPVSYKKEFKQILDTSIYTSFDFIKQYKTWKQVTIYFGDETKKVSGWNYDDLASKMVQKRLVGKIQPEKARERSKYKFTINITSDSYQAKVDIMGEDYVKITVNNLISYYEVSNNLFNYIKTDIFKIADSE